MKYQQEKDNELKKLFLQTKQAIKAAQDRNNEQKKKNDDTTKQNKTLLELNQYLFKELYFIEDATDYIKELK